MKIMLSQGAFALVSRKDFARLNKHKWFLHKGRRDKIGYARRWLYQSKVTKLSSAIFMQYEILGLRPNKKFTIDHRNLNSLDNRRKNLRVASRFQQAWNKKVSAANKSCGLKGVSFVRDKRGAQKYCIARITVKRNRIYLGTFATPKLAAAAYKKAALKYHKEFLRL